MTFCHCTVWFLLKIHDCLISFASEIAALIKRSICKLNWLLNSRQQVTDTVQRHQIIYTYLNSSEAMWKRKVLRSNWPKTTKKQLICLEEIELNLKRIKERAPNDCPLLASLSTDDQSYGASVCDLLSSPMRMMKRIYLKSNFKMIQSHWRHLHYSVPLLSFLIFYHICLVCFLFVRTILHPPGKSGPLSYPLLLDR